MSFVNMLANDVWTEFDILNRTEAMIASEFPPAVVAVLNRKATGASLGQYQLTAQEAADIGRYVQVSEQARLAGEQAAQDMALLTQVMALEVAARRVAQPADVPEFIDVSTLDDNGDAVITQEPNPDYAVDMAEREAAQAVVEAATPEQLNWFALRNPDPVIPDEVIPDPAVEPVAVEVTP